MIRCSIHQEAGQPARLRQAGAVVITQDGVRQKEIAEILTHLAFYVGWPKAWSAFMVI